ncbi:unnamed protein product [Adineta ricciae]|uniref:Uncharacterized protein n=1 Tax=Adineta ricciae TaxID=249248 RepID=A0A813R004_ADIRI|nr:unnamed protein product [Adineta ricciae]CAF1276426.1 unnamed protein product [Adineta ricciae]
MSLGNGIRFIWLDAHIGRDNEYDQFKKKFSQALEPTTVMPPDQIDSLICALNENAAPFLFADTISKALFLIQEHHDKHIYFISSGSLGEQVIPYIKRVYPQVHQFYIFCGLQSNYFDLVVENSSCLQIFTSELDLLVRLTRDISKCIIKQGEVYLNLHSAIDALKCFESAEKLEVTANQVDTLNDPALIILKSLRGYGDNIGLIQRAKEMNTEQQHSHPAGANAPNPEPRTENEDATGYSASAANNDDDPIAEEDSGGQ